MLPDDVKEKWRQWDNQVPVIGFSSGKYDLNMVKDYFVKEISYNKGDECNEDVFAAKKESNYMFLTTSKFKFSYVKNYIVPGLSYDAWCNSVGCRLQMLMFPYEWLDIYEKVSHVGPVIYEDFSSSMKSTITRHEDELSSKLFREKDCTTIGDWLRVYDVADVAMFLKRLGRWQSNTILIKLMYAKKWSVSQIYQ